MALEPFFTANSGKSKQASVEETSKITGGSLDYIIANAGYVSQLSQLEHFSVLYDCLISILHRVILDRR